MTLQYLCTIMIDYKKELNDSQYQAVTYCEGPSLVIAGAGSGKTRVLTYKIAYLLENGYRPWNILALTFTNKAAREMKSRVQKRVGDALSSGLWMGTFHSIFARILRMEASVLGFTSNFTIYDAADQKSLVKTIIKEMGLDDKTYKPGTVVSHISNAKNHLILPDTYASNPEMMAADERNKMPQLSAIYSRYWQRCRQADAMDFDDLLVYTSMLFHYHPEVLKKWSERFQYILVDEYQDTNFVQHSIVWQLATAHQHVCVVGDDAQSIYSFRGARIDNILEFSNKYKNTKIFKLEQNYRSTKTIVNAANSLIDKNSRQIHKEVFSENAQGEPIPIIMCYSDLEEAEVVGNKIKELHRKENLSYDDFAVLYRTNAQSRSFEEIFRKKGLPYKIYGGLSFYQRKEVKDVIAYFRLVINPNDEEAFKRIINYPSRGIGDTTIGKIISAANENQVSLWKVLESPSYYGLNVNKGTLQKLNDFRTLIQGFMEHVENDAYELGQEIIRGSGLLAEIYSDKTPENLSRQENLEELVNGLHDFVEIHREEGDEDLTLRSFLAEVSLLSDMDTDNGDSTEKITIMTVHSAKGLEFNTVFVVGMEKDLFPSTLSMNSVTELEEERRLFYVAITRAERHCFITFAKSRFKYGHQEMCSPSMFLKDIDSRYLDVPQGGSSYTQEEVRPKFTRPVSTYGESGKPIFMRQKTVRPLSGETYTQKVTPLTPPSGFKKVTSVSQSVVSSVGDLSVGNLIEHERFGIGEVLSIEGSGDMCKARVKFRNAGEKQLLLKYAKFKIIG